MKRLLAIALIAACPALAAQAPVYPIEAFAKLPQYSSPLISPDGRKIAATVVVNGKPLIYIKNRDDPNKVYPPISTDNAYFSQYMWGQQ